MGRTATLEVGINPIMPPRPNQVQPFVPSDGRRTDGLSMAGFLGVSAHNVTTSHAAGNFLLPSRGFDHPTHVFRGGTSGAKRDLALVVARDACATGRAPLNSLERVTRVIAGLKPG